MTLIDELKNGLLFADGAMGTLLYSFGVGQCREALNLSQPSAISAIHHAYLEAGAQVIQTNTFAANPLKLAHYGLENSYKAINQQAVKLARKAVEEIIQKEERDHKQEEQEQIQHQQRKKGYSKQAPKRYILGTIGGIRGAGKKPFHLEEIKESFLKQLEVLLAEGVDGILLETYSDLEELETVLPLARSATSLPIITQVTLHAVGTLEGGISLGEAFQRLEALGADVVGLNCRLGPHHMLRSLEVTSLPSKAFLSAYPNASLPAYQDGQFVYQCDPDYFAQQAEALVKQGVRLIGGCCGTTPEHIQAMAARLEKVEPVTEKRPPLSPVRIVQPKGEEVLAPGRSGAPSLNLTKRLPLHQVVKQRRSVIVELDPPKHLDIDPFLKGIEALDQTGIDAITMADNSLATPRISNMAMAVLVQKRTNLLPLVHITCRDRNLIGLESHLLGLASLGIDHILAVTGDPTKVGDLPGASSVYDLSSFGLIQMLKQMNKGLSYTGKSLKKETRFSVAAAFNPNVHHLDKAVARLEKKMAAGADYFISQPVFDHQQLVDVYEATKHLTAPIYIGIMPLTSSRNAEFLHHEVPGIKLTDEVRRRMAAHDDPERARQEGLAIAKELIDTAFDLFNGIYIITPFMRYELSVELATYINQKEAERTRYHGRHLV